MLKKRALGFEFYTLVSGAPVELPLLVYNSLIYEISDLGHANAYKSTRNRIIS